MRNLTIASCLSLVVLSSPVFADKAEECQLQADIVTRATELRIERNSQKKTLEIMTSGEDEAVAEAYIGAVPAIVDWIYTLKRKELKQEVGPGESYYSSCVAQ
ncbi:hypothetical protein SAMN05444000_10859 [Shimia gijangensis]|uniref:HdeA/HdeB family protein n=1 Tax=Shimia gijangensis TaxID=1470563 RepID=A0A1M6IZJ9_9RHOB|nr:hypothetical protein [Shimia gijangensis]SHJ39885.1 hypothetical protein SAMN05444000_10859 [Shimia gijangensis]